MRISPFSLVLFFILLTAFSLLPLRGQAQEIGDWRPETSFTRTTDVVQDRDGAFWVATDGGLYRWLPGGGGSLETLTSLDGMYRLSATAIAYDEARHQLWLGFNDGTLQSLDLQRFQFRTLSDITRNQSFSNKRINQLQVIGDELFVAAQFGIVVFDTRNGLVRDSYVNLGRFSRGTAVNAFQVEGDMIYAATASGIAAGNLNEALAVPQNWDNSDGQGNIGTLTQEVSAIATYADQLFAGTGSGNFARALDGGEWSETNAFTGNVERFRSNASGALLAVAESALTVLEADGLRSTHTVARETHLTGFFDDEVTPSLLLAGTRESGLAVKTDLSGDFDFIRPSGPDLNFFIRFRMDGDEMIAASTSAPGQRGVPLNNAGYYIFRNGEWVSFNRRTNAQLDSFNFNSVYRAAITENYYVFGSFGRGIAVHNKQTDEIRLFNATNSPLPGLTATDPFTVVGGIDRDADGNIWIAMARGDGDRLIRLDPETEEWLTFPVPDNAGADRYLDIYIDRGGQKWLPLQTGTGGGGGVFVNRVEADGTQTGIRLTTAQNQGNLPNDLVQAVVQDRRGEIWVGTGRGVARFLFPDRIIDGTAQDRQASFLINADPDADSPFLLRDVNATSIAVDAANQKWIGTQGDGLYLVDEQGRNILRHFTTANSPLFSNTIVDVAVDERSGTVFIATDEGLLTFVDTPRTAGRQMDDLFVYPNPFRYNQHSGNMIIEGLTDATLISVITVDGRLINRINARSGRAEWNVRDFNGNEVSSGVYMIIANDVNGNERGVGKAVIIR
ncbi:Por secretion system C-terminal sorting domain-containing protein [Cyclonatronum proteinivorum]|uniref:Por secretion system C-terminal sorting domain-containing protein n=2 Tax=Cyclonatronum proteinivorum TaxID=1457365 RepID=A0A345UPE5_9BACT|nr:Por secretion system C-terminal sorting domain-containing protein [Cyclonatronum proteinivorum]